MAGPISESRPRRGAAPLGEPSRRSHPRPARSAPRRVFRQPCIDPTRAGRGVDGVLFLKERLQAIRNAIAWTTPCTEAVRGSPTLPGVDRRGRGEGQHPTTVQGPSASAAASGQPAQGLGGGCLLTCRCSEPPAERH